VELDVRALCELPREGVLAATRPDEEHLHGGPSLLGAAFGVRSRRASRRA
jgi:hypothetical protein